MSISIKTNVAPSAAANVSADIVDVNKNSNGFDQSLDKALERINQTLSLYATHKSLSTEDFLKLRCDVALAYQDIRQFRNEADRFFIPADVKTKIDKQVTAKWFADAFKIVKPKKAAMMKVVEKYNNRRNGVKKALADVRACYAKGLRFETISGVTYVTAESYAKHMELDVAKTTRLPITIHQSAKSVTFSLLAAADTPEGGSTGESVSVETVAKKAVLMKNDIEAMTVEKMSMTNRLAIMDMVFAGLTALGMKHDTKMLNEREEIVNLIKPKAA